MKVSFDVDNDWVVAFATLSGLDEAKTQKVRQYLNEHESVEADVKDLGEDSVTSMKILGASLVLLAVGKHENNKRRKTETLQG